MFQGESTESKLTLFIEPLCIHLFSIFNHRLCIFNYDIIKQVQCIQL